METENPVWLFIDYIIKLAAIFGCSTNAPLNEVYCRRTLTSGQIMTECSSNCCSIFFILAGWMRSTQRRLIH